MHTNIDNDHGMATISWWLKLRCSDLPTTFPAKFFCKALTSSYRTMSSYLVITSSRTCFFKQCNGTAMGTPYKCTFATMYYLPWGNITPKKAQQCPPVLLALDQWCPHQPTQHPQWLWALSVMHELIPEQQMQLEWEIPGLTWQLEFMSLHIQLNPDGSITTSTHQKPINLYLFCPPTSMQPPIILCNLIYGTLHQLSWQNSELTTFEHPPSSLSSDSKLEEMLHPIILKAATWVNRPWIPWVVRKQCSL